MKYIIEIDDESHAAMLAEMKPGPFSNLTDEEYTDEKKIEYIQSKLQEVLKAEHKRVFVNKEENIMRAKLEVLQSPDITVSKEEKPK